MIDKIVMSIPNEIRHATSILRAEENKEIQFRDKLPPGSVQIPITIYWTRDTGRHDKAHFFNYYLDIEEEDSHKFKVMFHPEKLIKIN